MYIAYNKYLFMARCLDLLVFLETILLSLSLNTVSKDVLKMYGCNKSL